jgi:DNA-binding Lrp family transcriptional regulator
MNTEFEQRLPPVIQTGFPLENRPFLTIAGQIGCAESEVIETVRSLMDSGVIREFGPVFDASRLGYTSTLIAARVEHERTAELAAAMLTINEITHNYYRDRDFNIWFTVTARDRNKMDEIIRWVEKFPGVLRVLDLPVERMFKLSAVFGSTGASAHCVSDTPSEPPDEPDREVIRVLQRGLPLTEQPFLGRSARENPPLAG